MDLVAEARAELLSKTREQIERETAFKWAARAVAAYQLWHEGRSPKMFRDFGTYADEACEHAASADETGEALRSVRTWMDTYIPRGVL
jgi:hypothetical protein